MAQAPSFEAEDPNPAHLIAGSYGVTLARPLPDFGGGQPCFTVLDHRQGRRDLMAVQVAQSAPPRALPLASLASATVENMLLPIAHGRAAIPSGGQAWFVVMAQPPGPSLASLTVEPHVPWGERRLLDHALRPLALALEQLHVTGMTHRAIRPNNVFQSRSTERLALGGAWSAPVASLQPTLFEPPYSAMCDPSCRGEGRIADDIYALGVLLVLLGAGRLPIERLDPEAMLRQKLEIGSFAAITAGIRLSSTITDLVRGMLAEDPDHRPTPAMLGQPYAIRSRRIASRPPHRAQIPLQVGAIAVSDARTLAYALFRNSEQAAALLRGAAIDRWIRRTLGDPALAVRVEATVRNCPLAEQADTAPVDAVLVMSAIAVIDPLAPMCWRGLALFPDGIGPLAAKAQDQAEAGSGLSGLITEICEHEIPSLWGDVLQGRADLAMLRLDSRHNRTLLRISGWAGGVRRLQYALNPLLPCQAPALAAHCVVRLNQLLPALEQRAASAMDFMIDADIASFISARFNGRLDSEFVILAREENPLIDPPGHRGLAQLAVLERLCAQEPGHPWPGVAACARRPVVASLSRWRSRQTRQNREAALNRHTERGSLAGMLSVLVDATAQAEDEAAALHAKGQIREIDDRIIRLSSNAAVSLRRSVARNNGYEIAAGLGMIALAGAVMAKAIL
jgi:hypothetical protein